MLSIELPNHLEERLAKLEAETGRSKSFYIKESIEENLTEIEDKFRAINTILSTENKLSLDELERDFEQENM